MYASRAIASATPPPAASTCDTTKCIAGGNKDLIALLDQHGSIAAKYTYSPFGKLISAQGANVEECSFRFSSEYLDTESGLTYYNYRYYSPQLGHWLSRDPIEEEGGINYYAFVINNPLYWWDNLGLTWYKPWTWWSGGDSDSGKSDCKAVGGEYKNKKCCCKDKEMDPSSNCCYKSKNIPENTEDSGVETCVVYWMLGAYHSYIKINDWTMGYGGHGSEDDKKDGHTYPTIPKEGEKHYCHSAKRKTTGSLPNGKPCKCATHADIQACVKKHSKYGADTRYSLCGNSCGNWTIKVTENCCLEAVHNASKGGWWIWDLKYPGRFEDLPAPKIGGK